MSDEVVWVRPAAFAFMFLMLLMTAVLWSRKHKAQREREAAAAREQELIEAERRERIIRKAVEDGVTNEHGENLCVVCGQLATHLMPRTGRMWFDKIPGLRTLNDLMAMPWRYSIEDDKEEGKRLCTAHRKSAVASLKSIHAQMRHEHATFNTRQQHKLHVLEQGGLVTIVKNETAEIQRQLGIDESVRAMFTSHIDDSNLPLPPRTHVLSVSSSAAEDTE